MEISKPKLRFPSNKDDYQFIKIGDITCKVGSGSTPKGGSKVYQKTGVLFIRSQNVNNNTLQLDDVTFINESIHSKMSGSTVEPKDILLNITGASIGRSCVVPSDFTTGNVNQHVAIIRLNEGYSPEYIQCYLSSEKGQKQIFEGQAGGAREGLNFQNIRNLRIVLPSFIEQQKIASFLTTIDEKIQNFKKQKSLLEDYKKGMIQKIFSHEMRFKDVNGKEFPEWKERCFNEVLFEHGLKSSGSEEVFSVSVHKGLINQIEHLGRSFSAKDTSHYNRVLTGDIVYTKSPTGDFPFGIIKQSRIDKSVIVSPLYGVFTPETYHLGYILNVYFESVINTHNYLSPIIQKGAKNTINITNQNFLSRSLVLPVSHEEQKKIADFLLAIDIKIEKVKTQIRLTEEWKKGLLQQMFV